MSIGGGEEWKVDKRLRQFVLKKINSLERPWL